MNRHLFLTCESGKLLQFDKETCRHDVLYQHQANEYLFGIACHGNLLYFAGCTFLATGQTSRDGFQLREVVKPYKALRGVHNRLVRYLWKKLGVHSRVIPHNKPYLHQMNIYDSTIYIAATSWNEIWILDLRLNLRQRIKLQPYVADYHHINNVFSDGKHFYACLNRYAGEGSAGGYAKFDQQWNELERRALGWESHALCVIEGRIVQLSLYPKGTGTDTGQPPRAGLMINETLVFEYDYRKYFCKDFSMDDEHIYIVGGENVARDKRAKAAGVVFVLNHQYELLKECIIPGVGGINGCRLPELDYSNGLPPSS